MVHVSAGEQHSMALLGGGAVLTFGNGQYGRLGHGDSQDQSLPKAVEALRGKEVVQVSAGRLHSAVLLEGGAVLTFGCGRNNRLGHGNRRDHFLPQAVASLRGLRVVEVVAGGVQTVVLTGVGGLVAFCKPEDEDEDGDEDDEEGGGAW